MPNRTTGFRVVMKEQLSLYVFVAVLLVTGVVFGVVMVGALSLEQQEELSRYLGSFMLTIDNATTEGGSFVQLLGLQVKLFVLIWILGMSVVGLPILFALDFLKGVLIGFTVGYLVGQYSWKGLLFAMASVMPQNMVILPCLLVASVMAMGFSMVLVNNRLLRRSGSISQPFIRYTLTMAGLILLLAGVSLYEAELSPHVMSWVTPMMNAS